MALRPGRCYSKHKKKPYTRISTRKPRKSYVKGVPGIRIHQFEVGTKGKYPVKFHLVSNRDVQIRSNALEAARIATNRLLSLELGDNYFLRILPFPHTILRENKMIFGAHADRLQDGMRRAFGKPIGVAARVKTRQTIISIGVTKDSIEVAKQALKRGKAKLPMPCQIVINQPGD